MQSFNSTKDVDLKEEEMMTMLTAMWKANSSLLSRLADNVSLGYKDIIVERKFTSNKQILAGVTFDYRHLENSRLYKEKLEPYLKEIIHKSQSS